MDAQQVKDKLLALKELLSAELISQADFDKEKAFLLGQFTGSSVSNIPQTPTPGPAPTVQPAQLPRKSKTPLEVFVDRDIADTSLLRIQLKTQFEAGGRRKRVMVLLLDRSGSMAYDWKNVVKSVQAIVTPQLLSDPDLLLKFVVYAIDATVLETPSEATLGAFISQLENDHRPRGQATVFRSAFRAVTSILEQELEKGSLASIPIDSIDLQILLFTDGCDTSLKTTAESAASARSHFDAMQVQIKNLNIGSSFVYVAAYSPDHDAKQCQYMSDKYQYIDRPDTLSTKLAALIGEMTSGTGMCSLQVKLPKNFELAEPIPLKLPIDGSSLVHHIFVKTTNTDFIPGPGTKFSLEVSAVGSELQEMEGFLVPEKLTPGSFQHHSFVLDRAAFQLRCKSREMTGKATSQDIANLRVLLDVVRRDVHESRKAAMAIKTLPAEEAKDLLNKRPGNFGAQTEKCRLVLRKKISLIDTLADRLSHVVGEHENTNIQNDLTTQAMM